MKVPFSFGVITRETTSNWKGNGNLEENTQEQ